MTLLYVLTLTAIALWGAREFGKLEKRENIIYASSKAFRNSMIFLIVFSLFNIVPYGVDSYFSFALLTLIAIFLGYIYVYSHTKFQIILLDGGIELHTMPLLSTKIAQFNIAIDDIDRLENKELSSYLYFFNTKANVKEGEGLPISNESIEKLIDHMKKFNPELRIT